MFRQALFTCQYGFNSYDLSKIAHFTPRMTGKMTARMGGENFYIFWCTVHSRTILLASFFLIAARLIGAIHEKFRRSIGLRRERRGRAAKFWGFCGFLLFYQIHLCGTAWRGGLMLHFPEAMPVLIGRVVRDKERDPDQRHA